MTSRDENMINNLIKLSQLQTKILEKIRDLDEKQIESILNNNVDFRIQVEPRTYKKSEPIPEKKTTPLNRGNNSQQNITKAKLEEISNNLQVINDKTEGCTYLEEVCKNRKELELLSKFLDVDVKGKNLDQLRQAIIESTIGARLRSSAIQGTTSEVSKSKEIEVEAKVATGQENFAEIEKPNPEKG